MKNLKEQKGITLVALVVTIIVLLILAGITIALVMQGDSVFGKAEQASKDTNEASIKECVAMALMSVQTEYADPTTLSLFNDVNKTDASAVLEKANAIFNAELGKNMTVGTLALTKFNDSSLGTTGTGTVTYSGKTYTVTIDTKATTSADQIKVVPQ